MHPRTRAAMHRFQLALPEGIRALDPLGYLAFVGLIERARLVLSDSGGVQEEASVLGTPCLTLRENTERPITIELGTNVVVGTDPIRVVEAGRAALSGGARPASIPLWDGQAATRIAQVLLDHFRRGA
jgi:UDP-N-acetylglucosamine 2-epimerase (non-hydrolysing)